MQQNAFKCVILKCRDMQYSPMQYNATLCSGKESTAYWERINSNSDDKE